MSKRGAGNDLEKHESKRKRSKKDSPIEDATSSTDDVPWAIRKHLNRISAETKQECESFISRLCEPGHEVILYHSRERAKPIVGAESCFGVTVNRPQLKKLQWSRTNPTKGSYLCVCLPAALNQREESMNAHSEMMAKCEAFCQREGMPLRSCYPSARDGFHLTRRRPGVKKDPLHWRKFLGNVPFRAIDQSGWGLDVDATITLCSLTVRYLSLLWMSYEPAVSVPNELVLLILLYIRSPCLCCPY